MSDRIVQRPIKPIQKKELQSEPTLGLSVVQELQYLLILAGLWGLATGVDQLWLALDHAVPSWDPADHLIGALNYWWTLQPHHWWGDNVGWGHLWTALWTLSSKYPPLLYLSTAPFLSFFGRGADSASLVNVMYTGILVLSVYGLGRVLFRAGVGLWAAGLCLLFPQFYSLRTGYFMDYPLTALVTASLFLLTLWSQSIQQQDEVERRLVPWGVVPWGVPWGLAIGFGLTFGLALLMKQTAVFFLVMPLLWLGFRRIVAIVRTGNAASNRKNGKRPWIDLGQLIGSLILSFLMILPWSQANWIFQISAAINSNSRSAAIEGDPTWHTLAGWTHYWFQLPRAISYPLLIVPIVGLLFALLRSIKQIIFSPPLFPSSSLSPPSSSLNPSPPSPLKSFLWLALCLLSTYLIWTAIANKDSRYIMPWLPLWSIVLAYGLLSFPKKWYLVKWLTIGIAGGLMVMNLFPVGGGLGRSITRSLAPGAYHQPYLGESWPHDSVVETVIAAQPYQLANIGVLPSTPEINQHNFTYVGNRHDFQVYARRMGKEKESLERDVRSLSWFLSVTPPNLNHHSRKSRQRQQAVLELIKNSKAFKRYQQWTLPDGSRLNLFRRQRPPVEVKPVDNAIANFLSQQLPERVHLDDITVPQRIPPGHPVPVTYQWTGSWSALHDGLVFLTWQRIGTKRLNPDKYWTHDHNFGLGTLYPQIIQANQAVIAPATVDPLKPFTVTERMAMLPPASVKPGKYTLTATYLNAVTGETYGMEVPPLVLNVRVNANAIHPPGLPRELDFVTQLRQAALHLPDGTAGLDQVFSGLSRVNLYDPVQVYTTHAEEILSYRLQQTPKSLADVYGLALAHVLQRDANGAIAALEKATELDAENPFAHAELAFVNLYAWRPWAAQKSLDRAIALAPNVPEFKVLNTVAALMRGNLWQAWRRYRA